MGRFLSIVGLAQKATRQLAQRLWHMSERHHTSRSVATVAVQMDLVEQHLAFDGHACSLMTAPYMVPLLSGHFDSPLCPSVATLRVGVHDQRSSISPMANNADASVLIEQVDLPSTSPTRAPAIYLIARVPGARSICSREMGACPGRKRNGWLLGWRWCVSEGDRDWKYLPYGGIVRHEPRFAEGVWTDLSRFTVGE